MLFAPTHQLGSRVCRRVDVFDDNSEMRYGVVDAVYCIPQHIYGQFRDIILGPYDEVYSVLWDDGKLQYGFLSHGITAVTNGARDVVSN
jgi:hypothetical protein